MITDTNEKPQPVMTDDERAGMAERGERPIPMADTGDRWPLAVSTGAFHSGLREAMGEPTIRIETVPPAKPVDDLAVLRDYRRGEQRVLREAHADFETPAEDIRNALQIMQLYAGSAFDPEVRCDVEARLADAVRKLEFAIEFTNTPMNFVLRIAKMEQRLAAVEAGR
jgi:hypothetical protein